MRRFLQMQKTPKKIEEAAKDNFLVKFINGIMKSLKSKIGKE